MVEKKPGFFHRHTLAGRREEYFRKYDHVLAETQGVTRYKLEQKLEQDADRYAKRKVALDIFGVAIIAGASAFTINELRKGTLKQTLLLIRDRIVELGDQATALVHDTVGTIKSAADRSLTRVGAKLGDGFGRGMLPHVETALDMAQQKAAGIGEQAATGMISSLVPLLPMAGSVLQEQAGAAGKKFGEELGAGLRSQIPDIMQAAASQLRFPGLVFRRQPQK